LQVHQRFPLPPSEYGKLTKDTTGIRVRCEPEGMKTSTTDKIEGAAHEAKGEVKEVAGKVIGNPNLQAQGTTEKLAGKVQRKVGDVKKVFGK